MIPKSSTPSHVPLPITTSLVNFREMNIIAIAGGAPLEAMDECRMFEEGEEE
jgi:hypothetical protein